ncbi:MAG: DUF86 domain-containing protein [Candidatus Hydrogenedentes bacterium]|nr:DUF86 domain-containing protein [Candidatus Hydrogenedentota bacterium]
MPLDVKDAARLWDMLDAARTAAGFTKGLTFAQYTADRKTRNAVERNLEIIGEAARHVSNDARDMFPDIPWSSVIGLRNIIAHEYGEILHEKVWGICRDRLPALIGQFEQTGVENVPPKDES